MVKVFKAIMTGWFFTGLFAWGLFLIPGVEFLEQILGGLITDLDTFLLGMQGFGVPLYLAESVLELFLFNVYPLSWTLLYRPDDAVTIALMIVPWIASGFVTTLIAKPDNPKEMIKVGIVLIISNSIWCVGLFMLAPLALNAIPMGGGIISGVLNGISSGFTDMPAGVSAILTNLEGGGLFIGMGVFTAILMEGRGEK
nr:hypothetical protein [Candidatus Sigynarchaeota archaeon]